ncbi:hypothetical protein [Actinokineospora terrae]|uniref:Uncharacterized protein n=1 Tax=Actinokineospora terrae TaxID=155974 RepID=A0A1H9XP20_9PSEU|nr:hypothetical protein [Actinokineospora terrae]SES47918.1 hypothetical protein SAMN04487818_11837 [Actinokineospora terrae]
MTDLDLIEARLNTLRDQVERLEVQRGEAVTRQRGTLLVTALSGALLALTCATWRESSTDKPFTLWGMVDTIGFEALLVLVLLVGVALGSVVLAASPATANVLRRFVGGLTLATAAPIFYLNSVLFQGSLDTAAWVSLVVLVLVGCLTIGRTLRPGPIDWT